MASLKTASDGSRGTAKVKITIIMIDIIDYTRKYRVIDYRSMSMIGVVLILLIYVYIYIYIHTYNIYIYIYVYRERERVRKINKK